MLLLTKNVLHSGIVFYRIVNDFSVFLSFPEEGVEAVVWVHRDVEMGAKGTRCTGCLAYSGSGVYGCTIPPSMSEQTSDARSVRTQGG